MRRLLATAVVAALAATGLALTAGPASGAVLLEVELVSQEEPLAFSLTVNGDDCDEGTLDVDLVEANGTAVTPLDVVDVTANSVIVVLPSDTPPGEIEFDTSCLNGEFPVTAGGGDEWAAMAVTKVVTGSVPADAQFVVNVACLEVIQGGSLGPIEEVDFDLGYGPDGGTRYVYFARGAECTVTEPVNGGATTTTISPEQVFVEQPISYPVTVTNVFPAAVEPTFTG